MKFLEIVKKFFSFILKLSIVISVCVALVTGILTFLFVSYKIIKYNPTGIEIIFVIFDISVSIGIIFSTIMALKIFRMK